jgi:hypothetical protein
VGLVKEMFVAPQCSQPGSHSYQSHTMFQWLRKKAQENGRNDSNDGRPSSDADGASSDDDSKRSGYMMEYSTGDTSVGSSGSEEHDQEDPWWQKMLKQFGAPPPSPPAVSNENEKKDDDPDAKMETLEQTFRYLGNFHPTNNTCRQYLQLVDYVKAHPGNEWRLVQLHIQNMVKFALASEETPPCKCTETEVSNECSIWLIKAFYFINGTVQSTVGGLMQPMDINLRVWCFRFFVNGGICMSGRSLKIPCKGPVKTKELLSIEETVHKNDEKQKAEQESEDKSTVWKSIDSSEEHLTKDFHAGAPFYTMAIMSILLKVKTPEDRHIPAELFSVMFEALIGTTAPIISMEELDPLINFEIPQDAKIKFPSILRLIAHLVDGKVSRKTYETVLTKLIFLLDPDCKNANFESNIRGILDQKDWHKWLTPILLREVKRDERDTDSKEDQHTTKIAALAEKTLKRLAGNILAQNRTDFVSRTSSDEKTVEDPSGVLFNSRLELYLLSLPLCFSIFWDESSKIFMEHFMTVIPKLTKFGQASPLLLLNSVIIKADNYINKYMNQPSQEAISKTLTSNLEVFFNQTISLVFFSKGFQDIHLSVITEDNSTYILALSTMDALLNLIRTIQNTLLSDESNSKAKTRLEKRLQKLIPLIEVSIVYMIRVGNLAAESEHKNSSPVARSPRAGTPRKQKRSYRLDAYLQSVDSIIENLSRLLASFLHSDLRKKSFFKSSGGQTEQPCRTKFKTQLAEIFARAASKGMHSPEHVQELERMSGFFAKNST